MDTIIFFFILEVVALIFIKVFRASFLRKRSLPELSSGASQMQQSILKEPGESVQLKALFREYLETSKRQPEPKIEQKGTLEYQSITLEQNRKLPKTSTGSKGPQRALTKKHRKASRQVPFKECPYSFGYLKALSESLVPETCQICPKLTACRIKCQR